MALTPLSEDSWLCSLKVSFVCSSQLRIIYRFSLCTLAGRMLLVRRRPLVTHKSVLLSVPETCSEKSRRRQILHLAMGSQGSCFSDRLRTGRRGSPQHDINTKEQFAVWEQYRDLPATPQNNPDTSQLLSQCCSHRSHRDPSITQVLLLSPSLSYDHISIPECCTTGSQTGTQPPAPPPLSCLEPYDFCYLLCPQLLEVSSKEELLISPCMAVWSISLFALQGSSTPHAISSLECWSSSGEAGS